MTVNDTSETWNEWAVIAPRRKAIRRVENQLNEPSDLLNVAFFKDRERGELLEQSCWTDFARPLRTRKARLAPDEEKLRQVALVRRAKHHVYERLTLDQLPVELLDIIVSNLMPSRYSVLAFGLTSQYFLQIALRHVHKPYIEHVPVLAGTEVAFMCHQSSHIPEAFTSDDSHLRTAIFYGLTVYRQDLRENPRPYDFTMGAISHFTPMSGLAHEEHLWRGAASKLRLISGMSAKRWDHFIYKDLRDHNLYPRNRAWALRNLDTREFVATTALTKWTFKSPRSKKPARPLDFTDILLLRITVPSAEWLADKRLTASFGTWAGHRFDIVTLEDHAHETGHETWRDVSDDVLQEAAQLYQRYGERS